MKTITERYQWLIERFQKEFGKQHVIYSDGDSGHSFGIGISYPNYRQATKVEFFARVPRMTKLGRLSKYCYLTKYSLNERRDRARGLLDTARLIEAETMLIEPELEVNLIIKKLREGYENSKA